MCQYPYVKSQLTASQVRTIIGALCLFKEQYDDDNTLAERFQEHFELSPALSPDDIDALVGCLYQDLDGLEPHDDALDEAEVLNQFVELSGPSLHD